MKTYHLPSENISRKWHLIDAKDQVLGRLATQVGRLLSGKSKRVYTPHVDCGDFVVIINAEKITIKGNSKGDKKIDFRHSGYPGGYTITPYREFLKSNPDRAIALAISGMLPKNKHRSRQVARLKIYKGQTHPHGAHFAVKKPADPAKTPAAA